MELALFVFGIALFFAAAKIINVYNQAKKLQVLSHECFANIPVLIKKRLNLFEQILRLMASYNTHERKIFKDVAKSFGKEKNGGGSFVGRISTLHMRFPDLESKDLHMKTIDELVAVESELQYARGRVNSISKSFNMLIATFPNNYISKMFSFRPLDFISDETMGELDENLVRLAELLQ